MRGFVWRFAMWSLPLAGLAWLGGERYRQTLAFVLTALPLAPSGHFEVGHIDSLAPADLGMLVALTAASHWIPIRCRINLCLTGCIVLAALHVVMQGLYIRSVLESEGTGQRAPLEGFARWLLTTGPMALALLHWVVFSSPRRLVQRANRPIRSTRAESTGAGRRGSGAAARTAQRPCQLTKSRADESRSRA